MPALAAENVEQSEKDRVGVELAPPDEPFPVLGIRIERLPNVMHCDANVLK
jgi:hypothetical protein